MNILQQERFSRLQFPVHRIKADTPVKLFEVLPGLRRYFQKIVEADIEVLTTVEDEKTGEKKIHKSSIRGAESKFKGLRSDDLVKIIRYIVFVYDPDSDLIQEYPEDSRLLKDAAAKEAGFNRMANDQLPLWSWWQPYFIQIINDLLPGAWFL